MKYNKKVKQILAFSGWTLDKLADLLDVSNSTMSSWSNDNSEPKGKHAEKLDAVFDKLVAPYICELEAKADEIEKEILQQKIKDLPNDNICPVE